MYMQFYYTQPPVKIKKNKKLKKRKTKQLYVDKIARKIFLQYFLKTAHFFFLNSIAGSMFDLNNSQADVYR